MLLCSCSLFKTYDTTAKQLNVYLLEKAIKENDITKAQSNTVKAEFIDGEKYIPYLSLKQYASFYDPYLQEGANSEVSSTGSTLTWTISKGGQLYFAAMISTSYGEVMKAGEISNVIKDEVYDRDTKSMMYAMDISGDAFPINGSSGYATYEFDNTAFKHFRKNGEMYYPLGFYDNLFSSSSGLYHFYNYKNIYATSDADNFAKEFKDENGNVTSSDKEMAAITNGETIPDYLIDYNTNMFLFTMENFYGLKYNYEISSIKQYFKQQGLYNNLYAKDNLTRGNAYSSALASFDDNHTVFVSANSAWGEDKTTRYGGPGMMKRSFLRSRLWEMKEQLICKKTGYDKLPEAYETKFSYFSESKKTVMFTFDDFKFGKSKDVFKEDGSISEYADRFDTYFHVLNKLQEYRGRGVENVIIDISTNGGGVVGMMAKLLALISKKNKASLNMYDEASNVVTVNNVRVDADGDGQYTDYETFGNSFNIYLLTSDCSFSCGNAFPCYAQQLGVKIIGEKSGGGECAVNIHYMPNSEYIYHSSRLHLGSYDAEKKKFNGFEPGATPDYSLVPTGHKSLIESDGKGGYVNNIPSNFYDIEYLESLITPNKNSVDII